MKSSMDDYSWADEQLLADGSLRSSLPPGLVDSVRKAEGSVYLDAIASATLLPTFTDRLFILYEPLIVEISARWVKGTGIGGLRADAHVLTCLARILPLASYLKPRVLHLLASSQSFIRLREVTDLVFLSLPDDELIVLLTAIFRLFTYDIDAFGSTVCALQFASLTKSSNVIVRYLALQCISLLMKMGDATMETMTENHLGHQAMKGVWERREIDYQHFRWWEEHRWRDLEKNQHDTRSQRRRILGEDRRGCMSDVLSPATADIAGVLLPRLAGTSSPRESFVYTKTTHENLRKLAQALLEPNPILLSGPCGSGKTSLIEETARKLLQSHSMVVLNLNEQTDAKGLLGFHTTTGSGGSFIWQPGTLTRAVQEGRWVLIEDIDRAPSEVLGIILPIIEKGELYLPNRRQHIPVGTGFRILATMATTKDQKAGASSLPPLFLGARLWNHVYTQKMDDGDIEVILRERFPMLQSYLVGVLKAHRRACVEWEHNRALKTLSMRIPNLRNLLRLCRRMQSRLESWGVVAGNEPIPEGMRDEIFLDAFDCYTGPIADTRLKLAVAAYFAEEMSISPQQMQYCLEERIPSFSERQSHLSLGRATVPKTDRRQRKRSHDGTIRGSQFAPTRHAVRTMERILAAVQFAEPVLLVGDTGIGKTTLVQRLAELVGQKLTVVNLSQQSESSDLLGGFKPVSQRSLMLPLVDVFDELFDETFSSKKNYRFQTSVAKCVSRQNWRRLLKLWEEAVHLAERVSHNID